MSIFREYLLSLEKKALLKSEIKKHLSASSVKRFILHLLYRKIPKVIERDYHSILMDYSEYYRALNVDLKKRFRLRVFHLLNHLSFMGSPEIPIINREIRTVVACAIVEITFGLKTYIPGTYTNIIILPHRYMYPGYGEPFLGHIDFSNKNIYFSWRDVQEGYQTPNDAVNVALHEMAHLIEAENSINFLFTQFFEKLPWEKWAKVAFEKMLIIRSGQNQFLKNYGGINMREMFAVCIESFFEQSEKFKLHLPHIYNTLVELLGQDPCNKNNPIITPLSR